MCEPCDAARERLIAARRLRQVVEGKYVLAPALRSIFPLPETPADLMKLVAKLSH